MDDRNWRALFTHTDKLPARLLALEHFLSLVYFQVLGDPGISCNTVAVRSSR